jgi:acyl transferase domain-containing protein
LLNIANLLLSILNDDGKCYTFDSRGAGYGRGEGVATVILKRLDDALAAGDNIRAVIRGTGINQDGKTNGIAMPNQFAQQDLSRSIYDSIGLDPSKIGYVEAHGTGTEAGDNAETKSIATVFCGSKRTAPLFVGSIKSNIGHLESASGISGLLKAIMAVEKGQIPPNLNLKDFKKGLTLEKDGIKVRLKSHREREPQN